MQSVKKIKKSELTGNKLLERGERTRQEILKTSVDIASADGLEGLTIGRLAKELAMSKSGLFAHFGSKEDLQMATVDAAREIFVREIVEPTEDVKSGLTKLYAMLNAWLLYVENSIFRGGCFFFAVSAEMDDRPGKVREYIAELTKSWVVALENEIKTAIESNELKSDTDIEFLVFRLHAFVQEANWFYRLHDNEKAFQTARMAILQSLDFSATEKGKKILDEISI